MMTDHGLSAYQDRSSGVLDFVWQTEALARSFSLKHRTRFSREIVFTHFINVVFH